VKKHVLAAGALLPALITPWPVMAPAAAAIVAAATSAATVVETVSISPYGTILAWRGPGDLAGSPLYEFSGDANGKFGCSTKPVVTGTDEGLPASPASCTGPMSDFVDNAGDDDWPALSTTAPPIAALGANKALLGTVKRAGIGDQVTYAGHPLYLFDRPNDPGNCTPCGAGDLETVAPLYPWHGIWYAVSAKDGRPAPGPAIMQIESLPDGKTVLAAQVDVTADGPTVSVYALSGARGPGACTGACAVTWIPLRTSGAPQTSALTAGEAKEVRVAARADGTYQVTYEGKPLYLYSAEKFLSGSASGTAGNGNGLPGPDGGTFSVIPAH
jgi:predicted lipoprotein with Yx(FWY)xxD motif